MSVSNVTVTGTSAGFTQAGVREPVSKSVLPPSSEVQNKPDTAPAPQPAPPQFTENTYLSIAFDKESNRYVFRSVDKSSGRVINQYPAEDVLRHIAYFRDITGLTVDTGA